ncbi:MAG: M12 family metallo-peptidase [Bacteroidota bacterium]
MTTTFKVCTCILMGFLSVLSTINLSATTTTKHPTLDLFQNIQTGADKKRFVEDATYFTLNEQALAQVQKQKHETMTLQLPFGASKKLTVTLSKVAFLGDHFKVVTQSGNIHNTLSYSPGLFYRGAISGVKDALVTMNFFNTSVTGVLSLNGENYNIGRYGDYDSDTYVLYKERNLNASNPFSCATEDPKELIFTRNIPVPNGRSSNTVEVYVEADYALYQANQSSEIATTNFVTGLFNVVSAIYAKDDIDVKLGELKIWKSQDPYPTSSAKVARDAFGKALNGRFNGDVAHLLSNYKVNGTVPNGGSANIDALCDKDKAVGYTNITTDYKDYPTYSWTAYAVTHEIGHNLGSPHTHSCLWPAGPIDNCWCPEGNCELGPEPASSGGTVMSYCHLNPQWANDCELSASNPGINLAVGFGRIPSALIKSRINEAACLRGGITLSFQAKAKVKDEACNQQNGRIELTVSYGQSPYTYKWSNGATTKNIEDLSAGNYSVTITDASGKTISINESVNGSEPFIINAGPDQIIGCSEPIVTLDGSDSPSGFSYDYKWTSLENQLYGNVREKTLTVSEPGTYILTVSNTDTGCKVRDTVRVAEDFSTPSISLSADQLTCNQPTAQISAITEEINNTFNWSGPNGFTSTAANPVVSSTGTYTVETTSANGCTAESEITVSSNTEQPIISAQTGVLTCDNNTAQISATTNMAATFIWEGPNLFEETGSNQTVTEPGIYTVKVQAANGCSAETNVTVTAEREVPELTVSDGVIGCGNQSTQLVASSTASVAYYWIGPNDFQSSEQNPTVSQAGIYQVTITTENGCTNSAELLVAQETDRPDFVAKGGMLDCNNAAFTFVVSTEEENLTYEWTGPNGFNATEKTPTVTVAGAYTVTASYATGCSTTLSVQVEEDYVAPQITIKGEAITCAQSPVVLKGLSNDNIQSYTWVGATGVMGNTANIEVNQAGTYELTVKSANGCLTSETFTVEAKQGVPTLELKADKLTCANPTTLLKAVSNENLTFQWTGPQGFNSAENLPMVSLPGIYSVTATNENGCVKTASIEVEQTNSSAISFAATKEISCNNEVVMIDATASELTGNVLVEWTTEDGNILHKINDLMITVDRAGTYAMTVRDLDTECVTIQAITVNATPQIAARIENENILSCVTNELMLSAEGGNYTENTIFSWKTEDGSIISTNTAASIMVDEPGLYQLFVTDTITGCSDVSFTTVIANERPVAQLAAPRMITCNQSTTTISGAGSTVNSNTTIEWTRNGVAIPNSNDLFLTTNVAGIYTMTVTDTINQCGTTAEVIVEKHQNPSVTIAEVRPDDCAKNEGKISLDIPTTEIYKIEWSNGAGTATIENLAAGTYTATVTDELGCQTVISQSLQVVPALEMANFSITPTTCHDSNNGTIAVDIQGGNFPYEATWSNGETGLFVGNLEAGMHTLEVMDAKGCLTTFDFPINAPNPLVADLEVVHNDVMVEVAGGKPDYTFSWSDGTNEVYGSNFAPGKHFVKIADANGCEITKTFEVDATTSTKEIDKELDIMVFPNPTTDYFKIKKQLKRFEQFDVEVFNAAGQLVMAKNTAGLTIDEVVNTTNWDAGSYFVRVRTRDGTYVNKMQVIKQ